MLLLEALRIPVSKERTVVRGIRALLDYYHTLGGRRADLPYEIDGVVYKVDDFEQQRQLDLSHVRRNTRSPTNFRRRRPSRRSSQSTFRSGAPVPLRR